MGCELRCGICSQRRRCVHCDCSEDQEDDPFWWAFCEEQLQNQWARQGGSHYRQPNEQEEETSLQIQNQELFRFHLSCRSHHKDCRVNEKCWVGFFSFFCLEGEKVLLCLFIFNVSFLGRFPLFLSGFYIFISSKWIGVDLWYLYWLVICLCGREIKKELHASAKCCCPVNFLCTLSCSVIFSVVWICRAFLYDLYHD